MAKVLVLIFSFLCWVPALSAQADSEAARKQELDKLKKQAAQKQQELKKYRDQEKAISKEISTLKNRQAEAKRQMNKLASDISYVEKTILSTEDKREAIERSMPLWNNILSQEIAQHYLTPVCEVCVGEVDLAKEVLTERALTHKAEFAVSLQEENKAAKQKIYDFEKRNQKLMAQSSQIEQSVIPLVYD